MSSWSCIELISIQPQNEYIERWTKQHGRRSVRFCIRFAIFLTALASIMRKGRGSALLARVTSRVKMLRTSLDYAPSYTRRSATMKRYRCGLYLKSALRNCLTANRKKTIKAHEERNVKTDTPNEPSSTPLPQYLLVRSLLFSQMNSEGC